MNRGETKKIIGNENKVKIKMKEKRKRKVQGLPFSRSCRNDIDCLCNGMYLQRVGRGRMPL
jgi:hypothetical protein